MAVGDLSFAFNPQIGETPQTIAQKRAIANAILGNTSHAPRDIGEGLNSIGQALMYRQMMKGVNKAEADGNSGAAKVFGSLFGDQFPAAPAAPAAPLAAGPTVIAPKQADNANAPSADVASAGNTDLQPQQKALLDTIAGPESHGAYDVMYGGGKIADLSAHPHQAVPITSGPNAGKTSSAAGKYQFLGSTWDDQAKKLGLTDFSPASQDKAAWNLASETYKAKTGQDLNSVLQSGDPAAIAQVGKALSGTWTSLPGGIEQGTNTSKFVNAYQQALGNSPSSAAANALAGGQLPQQAPAPLPNPMAASGAQTQVASNDPSIGIPPAAPVSAASNDYTIMPDPLIEGLKWLTGGGGSPAKPQTGPVGIDPGILAAAASQNTPSTSQIGQPYAPPPMPAPYAAIQQKLASQPNDAKAAIARAMLGQGQSFPAEMGPQDIHPPVASSQAGNPDVVNAGLLPRGGQRVLDAMMNKAPMGAGLPMMPPVGAQGPVSAPSPAPVPPATTQSAPDASGKPQGPGAPGEIRKGADGKNYQYAETTGMAGATGPSGWIETSMATPQMPGPDAQGGLDPQTTQAAPLPPPTTVRDRPVAGAPAPDLSQIPAMAGGNSDVIAPGQQGPSIQQLMQAAADPFVMQKYGPMVEALLTQKMKQGDPSYALDIADKKLKLQLEQQQLGGNFRGDSLDAQAWNILQTADPTSKQYATAYSIVSQPKTQLVQTANGLVPVQVPPQLPGWLKAPGEMGAAPSAPGAPPAAAGAAPNASGGPANASAAIPGTKQPATEMQARNGAIGKILLNEVPTLAANFSALADPKGQLLNALPGGIGNAWQSPEYQQAANAVKASVSNVLYSLSGASSNPGEVLNQIGILTPAFGDSPATINDKLQRFKTYVRAISSEANDPELSKNVEDAIGKMDAPATPTGGKNPTSGSDADPLGLRK